MNIHIYLNLEHRRTDNSYYCRILFSDEMMEQPCKQKP